MSRHGDLASRLDLNVSQHGGLNMSQHGGLSMSQHGDISTHSLKRQDSLPRAPRKDVMFTSEVLFRRA